MKMRAITFIRTTLVISLILARIQFSTAQTIDATGCVGANFGIDAGLYSGVIEFGDGTPAIGTIDWFLGSSGHGIIDQTNTSSLTTLLQAPGNPTYERRMQYHKISVQGAQTMIDGIFARDMFGGSGAVDQTAFKTASKNAEDPAIWDPGPMKVLGKNDLVDVGGFMLRDGLGSTSHLWFYGFANRAEPGGDAYLDFEFYIQEITYDPTTGFTTGGPDLGHTAFTFAAAGPGLSTITSVGDFIYNLSLTGGGVDPGLEVRIWVSYTDYTSGRHPANFTWGPNFDGPFTGSPYGYASIIPTTNPICGKVNTDGQHPTAPPWGTKNTKDNTWVTTYADYSVVEMGLDMTDIGLDHNSLLGIDTCYFPIRTFLVKTRTSASFTSQLKDFAGPYSWGRIVSNAEILGDTVFSCLNPVLTLVANPSRTDITYLWTTVDGNILTNPTNDTIQVNEPGTYTLQETLFNGCPAPEHSAVAGWDPTKPLFGTQIITTTVSCNGSNGTIDLTVVGGTPNYSYLWSNDATTQDLTGLAAGTYTVTITDNIGCQTTATATVIAATATTITPTPTAATCSGYSNGSISISVTGKSPFTYLWSNGNITQNITNLVAGTFTVTVTDADGCTHTASATVNQPSAISFTYSKADDTNPSPSVNNGSINITTSGGTQPYTFLWSNAAITEDLTTLAYGSYTLTVTDAHGCSGTVSVFIYEPEICNDGIDNDGDGLTDCLDSDCAPATPSVITPSDPTPCTGVAITYSVTLDAAYDSYEWSVPSNATINGSQVGNSISVTWSTITSGQICVRGKKWSCYSPYSCTTVTPHTIPDAPQSIIKN